MQTLASTWDSHLSSPYACMRSYRTRGTDPLTAAISRLGSVLRCLEPVSARGRRMNPLRAMHRACTLRLRRNAANRGKNDGMALHSAGQWRVAVASKCSPWLDVLRVAWGWRSSSVVIWRTSLMDT